MLNSDSFKSILSSHGWRTTALLYILHIINLMDFCIFTASLPTATEWSRENDDLPVTALQRGSRLEFRRLRLTDAGMYSCEAKNSLGSAQLYVNLIIEGAPREFTHYIDRDILFL